MGVTVHSDPFGPVFYPLDRSIFRIRIAWDSYVWGLFQLDRSTIGGTDALAPSSWSQTFMGPYDDITADTDECEMMVGGRSDDLSQVIAGTATLKLRDPDGRYNPQDPESLLAGKTRPMRPCKIDAFFDGSWHDRWYGFIRTMQWDPGARYGTCQIECNDLFMWLESGNREDGGNNGIANPVIARVTNPTVGQCVGLILDSIGWIDANMRAIDPGDTIAYFEADGTRTPLQLLQDLLNATRGYFFIDRSGRAVYEDRNTRYLRPSYATLENTMTELSPGSTLDRVQNRWTAIRQHEAAQDVTFIADDGAVGFTATVLVDGTPQVTLDDTSRREFGLRDAGAIASPYFPSDAFAKALTEWGVSRTKDPQAPIWSMDLDYRTRDQMIAILNSGFGKRITIGAEKSNTAGDYFIEQIRETITRRDRNHRCSMILSAVYASQVPFTIGTDSIGSEHGLGF